jgi:hypothetical protein
MGYAQGFSAALYTAAAAAGVAAILVAVLMRPRIVPDALAACESTASVAD